MKILLLGANGQVGWELQRSLAPLGELKSCDRHQADLENDDQILSVISGFNPDVIVNAAAYTAVDKAESEQVRAQQINTTAVGLLADQTKQLDALLIHYSTDYVFDGTKDGYYSEQDQVNPQSVYGKTKYEGEQLIQQSGCDHLIFRTSWVFATRGHNFAKTMIRLAKERDELKVVADQIGVPTSAELIADVTALAITTVMRNKQFMNEQSGIYNLVPAGRSSWYEFAKYVITGIAGHGVKLKLSADNIVPITTSEYPLPATRPANSLMSTAKLEKTFALVMPDWRGYVDRLIIELAEQESL